MSNVAVVILNYNGAHYIQDFLPSIIESSGDAAIHIVDNASTDNSVSLIQDEYPQTHLHQFSENLGFSKGYNHALKDINADYFVILNSDVKVTPHWIEPMVSLLEMDENIAAVQPKILSLKQPDHFEYAGAGGGFLDNLGYPFCRGRIFNILEKDNNQYNNTVQSFWASGACLCIRSKDFLNSGGFDEDFFAHMEEIDLCWRLQNQGKKIFYCGSSTVYHLGGGTLSHANPYKTYLNFNNSLSMILKNEPGYSLIWKMPTRGFLDFIAAIKFSLFDSPAHGFSVLKAHFYFWMSFGKTISKRRKLEKLRTKSELSTRFSGSIVFEHFVKGKKNFNQLNFLN